MKAKRARRILAVSSKMKKIVVSFELGCFSNRIEVILEGGQERFRIGRERTFADACDKLKTEIVTLGLLHYNLVPGDLRAAHDIGGVK